MWSVLLISIFFFCCVEKNQGRKKTEKLIKPRKQKKITEKSNRKKKLIKILKKPTGSVQFRFYKLKTEKTKPNPNKKTEPNRVKLKN